MKVGVSSDEEFVETQKMMSRLAVRKRRAESLEAGFRLLGEHYYADRIRDCSGRLVFSREADSGELRLNSTLSDSRTEIFGVCKLSRWPLVVADGGVASVG